MPQLAQVDLTNEDMVTIIEALKIAGDTVGNRVRFLETHPPNAEDESGYKERYAEGMAGGTIFLRRASVVLRKFAIAGGEAIQSAHE